MAESIPASARLRSPAYPYFDLEEAVERLEMFHRAEKLHRTDVNTAATDIGYKRGSNRGWRALSTLVSFGLLDEEGLKENRLLWLSDLGKEIVFFGNKESKEAKQAIRQAALKPAIHLELWELWLKDGQGLPSDETMRRYLIKEKAFNPQAVDSFIQEFKATLTFAGLIKDGKITSSNNISGIRDQNSDIRRSRTNTGERMNNNRDNLQDNTIPLMGGATAILTIPRPLGKKNFELIKGWLTLMEEALTEENNKAAKDQDESREE
jgi:hypothetical protein